MRITEEGTFPSREPTGEVIRMDCCGMRCPQPVLRLAVESAGFAAGTIIEITGDCPTFEKDVRVFCERRRKALLGIRTGEGKTSIRIRC
jgi:tRNA 2-thiouridine synthesizing protein A